MVGLGDEPKLVIEKGNDEAMNEREMEIVARDPIMITGGMTSPPMNSRGWFKDQQMEDKTWGANRGKEEIVNNGPINFRRSVCVAHNRIL